MWHHYWPIIFFKKKLLVIRIFCYEYHRGVTLVQKKVKNKVYKSERSKTVCACTHTFRGQRRPFMSAQSFTEAGPNWWLAGP